MNIHETLIEEVINIAMKASRAILEIYKKGFSIKYKKDSSPVTEADTLSNSIISEGLRNLLESVPVLSEEEQPPLRQSRQNWTRYWLVDPLDGTNEFIQRNGEFTINIALMERVESHDSLWLPIFGFVYVPLKDEAYLGWVSGEHNSIDMSGQAYQIQDISKVSHSWKNKGIALMPIREIRPSNLPLRIMVSRSHQNAQTMACIRNLENKIGRVDMISLGSSLKMCKVASGYAHAYPRVAPTMEWDTAAAHGICRAVGVSVIDLDTCTTLQYNKHNLTNAGILVTGIPEIKEFSCTTTN